MGEIRDNIAKGLKDARKKKGMNVDEVGRAIGKSGKTISAWEVGRGQPDGDELVNLCKLFEVPLSQFYGRTEYAFINLDGLNESVDVPVFGRIAAGKPMELDSAIDSFPIPEKIRKSHPNSFLMKVDGDSMNRTLPNGCLALVDTSDKTPDEHGAFAVCVNGYKATIKRVKKLANGFKLIPDSHDPTFRPTVFDYNDDDTDTITIIGRVVWATMPYDYEI